MTNKSNVPHVSYPYDISVADKIAYIQLHVDPKITVNHQSIVTLTKDMKVFKQTKTYGSSSNAGVLVNLIIPAGSMIHVGEKDGGYFLKCRADKAKVVSQFKYRNCARYAILPIEVKTSQPKIFNGSILYKSGGTIKPLSKFYKGKGTCESGIHFFVSLEEAYHY